MCGVQEVQEPPQLIAIELAVFIEVILLEPAVNLCLQLRRLRFALRAQLLLSPL